jgi:hypothetical protein
MFMSNYAPDCVTCKLLMVSIWLTFKLIRLQFTDMKPILFLTNFNAASVVMVATLLQEVTRAFFTYTIVTARCSNVLYARHRTKSTFSVGCLC